PFLANVGRGRNIPRERLEEVARHYEAMPGGRSPLNALTEAQAAGLRAALVRGGRPLPVYVGMRNWHPFLHETLAAMAADGRRRAVGLILSAFRSEASWERYAADVAAARARVAGAPEVVYAPPWFEHEHFIAAAADRAAAALAEIPPQARERTPLVFTAHSIPRAMAATSPYVADFGAAAAAVARRLRHARWLLAYQSRSGGPRDGAGARAARRSRRARRRGASAARRHHRDGARGRLPRRGRPRLVPVREAVGARALPAARCRGPAGPHRRSFPQGLRLVPRPA